MKITPSPASTLISNLLPAYDLTDPPFTFSFTCPSVSRFNINYTRISFVKTPGKNAPDTYLLSPLRRDRCLWIFLAKFKLDDLILRKVFAVHVRIFVPPEENSGLGWLGLPGVVAKSNRWSVRQYRINIDYNCRRWRGGTNRPLIA